MKRLRLIWLAFANTIALLAFQTPTAFSGSLDDNGVNTLSEAYRAQAAKLYQRGQLQAASDFYEKALAETNPTVGGLKVNLQQSSIYSEWGLVESNIAIQYENSRDANSQENVDRFRHRAIQHLESALEGQERLLGTNNLTCARTLDTLASTLLAGRDYNQAESLFAKALAIRNANGDSGSAEVGFELWKLADIDVSNRRYGDGLTKGRQALAILTRVYGPTNAASMQCSIVISDALFNLGRYDECETIAAKCHHFWYQKKGASYSLTQHCESLLNQIHDSQADRARKNLGAQLERYEATDPKLVPFIQRWKSASAKAHRTDDVERATQWLVGMTPTQSKSSRRSTGKH